MEDTLQIGVEFKRILEKISSQLQTHIDTAGTHLKKQKVQVSSEQTNMQEEPTKKIPRHLLPIGRKEQAVMQDPCSRVFTLATHQECIPSIYRTKG